MSGPVLGIPLPVMPNIEAIVSEYAESVVGRPIGVRAKQPPEQP